VEIAEARERLKAVEADLADKPFVEFHAFQREGRALRVAVTRGCAVRPQGGRLAARASCSPRSRNAAYGYDERQARSGGGRDGIFLLDAAFRPANAMMHSCSTATWTTPKRRGGAGRRAGVPLAELLPGPAGCRTTCGCWACWRGARTPTGSCWWTVTGRSERAVWAFSNDPAVAWPVIRVSPV